MLGLGVGNSAVGPIGLRRTRAAELREGVAMLRTLLSGAEWDFGGGVRSRLRDPRPEVPIHLAASGPRNLRPAGEIADGVILLSGVSAATPAAAGARVRDGAAAAGRERAVPLTVSPFCTVTDDVAAAARQLKPVCASIAQNGGADFLAFAGIRAEVPAKVEGVYPDLVHAEDWEAATEICSAWASDEAAVRFAEEFCLVGTEASSSVRSSTRNAEAGPVAVNSRSSRFGACDDPRRRTEPRPGRTSRSPEPAARRHAPWPRGGIVPGRASLHRALIRHLAITAARPTGWQPSPARAKQIPSTAVSSGRRNGRWPGITPPATDSLNGFAADSSYQCRL